jgi:hypothetical protein
MSDLSSLQGEKAQLVRDRANCTRDRTLLVRLGESTSEEDNRIRQIDLKIANLERRIADAMRRELG